MYRITIIVIILGLIFCYFFFTKPDIVVVTEKGKVTGVINKGRALVQGKKFWQQQLDLANAFYNESLKPHPPTSTELRDLYARMREYEKELDDRMQTLYTPEEKLAMSLRVKADSIERDSKWRSLDEADETTRLKNTSTIKSILAAIASKLESYKPAASK